MSNLGDIKLTAKQKLFCEAYLRTTNGTQSALEAGYSPKTAGAIASENLKKPKIEQYIKERMQNKLDGKIASADKVLEFYTDVMEGKVKDAFGMEASLDTRVNAAMQLGKRHGLDKRIVEVITDVPTVVMKLATDDRYEDDE